MLVTDLPILKKADFSVRNLGRLLRGYRRAAGSIARGEIARECSYWIYDRADRFLGRSSPDIVMPVSFADAARLAPFLLRLEDRRFYRHSGLDWSAFARAAVRNIQNRRIVQGGSTISMQLARNTLIEPSRSLTRKTVESGLARRIEHRFTKEEILRLYCEQVFMGNGLRGFQSAAFFIYRKPIASLDDAEICGLLGLLRAPGKFTPYRSVPAYCRRQKFVSGLLTGETPNCAPPNPVRASLTPRPRISRAVKREAEEFIGGKTAPIKRAGTTLNSDLQKSMDEALCEASRFPGVSAMSAVVLDNGTGETLAESSWERGREMEFSPALDGLIQPGSTFKTFALIAAVEQGISLDFPLMSAPFSSERVRNSNGSPWIVRNYGGVYRGEISLADAFVASDNCAFARLAEMLDRDRLFAVYRRFGLLGDEVAYPSIVLGATKRGVSMAKLAAAYQAIANNGVLRPKLRLTRYIESHDGGLVWPSTESRGEMKVVLNAEDVPPVQFALRVAARSYGMPRHWGKTGTTDSGRVIVAFGERMTCALSEFRATLLPAPDERGYDKSVPIMRRVFNKLVR